MLAKWAHGLPPSIYRTHFCTPGSKKPHRKKTERTGFNLVTGILAGYTIPSFKKLASILENCHTPWLQNPKVSLPTLCS